MADNNKVTIDAAWFAELWKIANEADEVCENCVREKCGECKVVKDRDELKAKLDCADVDRETYKDRAEAAERCVEDIAKIVFPNEKYIESSYGPLGDIIRAYREAKEAK